MMMMMTINIDPVLHVTLLQHQRYENKITLSRVNRHRSPRLKRTFKRRIVKRLRIFFSSHYNTILLDIIHNSKELFINAISVFIVYMKSVKYK